MNSLRKVFGFLLAGLMLAAFASPGVAQSPSKIYSLTMPLTAASGSTFPVTYTNQTPTGNSNINSVSITPPAGWTITAIAFPQGGALQSASSIPAGPGQTVGIINVPSVKTGGGTWTMNVTATFTGATSSCAAWGSTANTGNNVTNGQPFALVLDKSQLIVNAGTACTYTLATTSPVTQNTTGATVTATFTNPSTSQGSFGALTLALPSNSGLTIKSASLPTGTSGTVSVTAGSVSITNISPAVASGTALALTLTVDVAATCTTSTVTWIPTVYAGTALSGMTFTLATPPNPTTTISAPACSVSFSPNPPTGGTTGQALPEVDVVLNGGSGGGNVVMTSSCALSGTTSVMGSGGVAKFLGLIITAPQGASCTLTATADEGMATSKSFIVLGGPIACEPSPPYAINASDPSAGDINSPGYWLIQRGAYNKDGGPCTPVGIVAINSIVGSGTGQSVTFNWDTGTQPGAAWVYTITWNPEYVDMTTGGTGLPSFKTKVQWNGSPYLSPVPGRACIAWNPTNVSTAPFPVHYLPLPYGTLGADITTTTTPTNITVNHPGTAISPNTTVNAIPPVPFAINIDNERMTVTATSGSTWTVDRGAGHTTAAPHCAVGTWNGSACVGALNTNVMSNPLPVNPADGYQQRVCIAEEGWTIVPAGAPNCPVQPATGGATVPTSCALVTTTIYDVGDTTIIRN